MDYRSMFKGDYIAAAEFGGKSPTMTIKSVELVEMEDDKGKTKTRGVAYFNETERGWVLNRTNAILLAGMWGPETNDWVGKKVTLHALEVQFGRERVLGVRVKGSPHLEEPLDVPVKLPKRRALTVRLMPTGGTRG